VSLGYFATAEEAALCVARTPEGRAAAAQKAAAAPPLTSDEARQQAQARTPEGKAAAQKAAAAPPLTSEEARQQAQAEGLTLLMSKNNTGYSCVYSKPGLAKPYQARVCRGGKVVHLGYFGTNSR